MIESLHHQNLREPAISAQLSLASENNPKILHRIYFSNFAPFNDPFEHYLETWRREMPDYQIKLWNASNLDVSCNEWVQTAWKNKSPVYLSEYFRWKVLDEFGGIYLDADCEVLNGSILSSITDDLFRARDYDVFFGTEEASNGHPTAQTVGAKKGSDLVKFMMSLYESNLAPLWHWRETRGLIGPQLMSLYFLKHGVNIKDDGFFKKINEPVISARAKVYPQVYFSPKFSLLGATLNFDEHKTCVYHMFANSNLDFDGKKDKLEARRKALTFSEYRAYLDEAMRFPRKLDLESFTMVRAEVADNNIRAREADGRLLYGPYISLPAGCFFVRIHFASLPLRGSIDVSIYCNAGKLLLGHEKIEARNFTAMLQDEVFVQFEIKEPGVSNLEVTIDASMIDYVCIDAIWIDKQIEAPAHKTLVHASLDPVRKKSDLRILHRIYFGFDGKPDAFQTYLQNWQEKLPDFKIMNWNASNLPMDINPYVRALFEERDHAFLTDYFRWYVLREFGGTYLDADVEIVNGPLFSQLIDELSEAVEFDAMIGIDEKSGGWFTAHSMASKPASDLARFMCDLYDNFGKFRVWRKKGFYFWAPQLVALYFADRGFNPDGMGTMPGIDTPLIKSRVKVYPQDWFSPLAPSNDPHQPFILSGISDNTCLCHHFACSWHSEDSVYLKYSKDLGGQTNVLLAELIKRDKQRETVYTYNASVLKTVVGNYQNGGIETRSQIGCLSFGPYTTLSPGKYKVTFGFSDVRNATGVSVDVIADFGKSVILRASLPQAAVQEGTANIDFELDDVKRDVEFRTFVGERTKLKLMDVSVQVAKA